MSKSVTKGAIQPLRTGANDSHRDVQSVEGSGPCIASGPPSVLSDGTRCDDVHLDAQSLSRCPRCGFALANVTSWFAVRYPLLTTQLLIKGSPYQATFTISDVAHLLGVSIRAIQDRVSSSQLPTRDLPGRAKFLPDDLEEFLRNSKKKK